MKYTITIVLTLALVLPAMAQYPSGLTRDGKDPAGFSKNSGNREGLSKWIPAVAESRTGKIRDNREKALLTGRLKLDSTLSEVLDPEESVWKPGSKESFQYDAQGNNFLYTYYLWDGNLNLWVGNERTAFEFDAAGNITRVTQFLWDIEGGTWTGFYKVESSWENGLLKTERQYYWDESLAQWKSNGVNTYQYEDGLMVSAEFSEGDANSDGIINYLDRTKTGYFYDDHQNLMRETVYVMIADDNQWIESWKAEYARTENPKSMSSVTFHWNKDAGQWIPLYKTEESYDQSGKMVLSRFSFYDSSSGTWLISFQDDYSYDGNGDLISMISSDADYETGILSPVDKWEYSYDVAHLWLDLILPYGYPLDYFKHKVTGFKLFVYREDQWVEEERGNVYYSALDASGIRESQTPKIRIFPNPSSGLLMISGLPPCEPATIDFIDASGKQVSGFRITANSPVPVDHLPAGTYIYRLKFRGQVQTGKVVRN